MILITVFMLKKAAYHCS